MPDSTTLEAPTPRIVNDSWTNLKSLIQELEQDGSNLGSIKDALEQFSQLEEVHERFESIWNENGTMKNELEDSFRRLRENCAKGARLRMTGCIRGLCRDIKVELAHIRHYSLEPNSENGEQVDSTKLLDHYRRIQTQLHVLLLNTDSGVWGVLNQDTDRKTHLSDGNHNYTRTTGLDSSHSTEVRRLYNWIQNSAPGTVCWVPDVRKTGTSRALCAQLDATHKLGANFFLSGESCDLNSIIPSIASQLANYSTPFRSAYANSHPPAPFESLEVQFEELISKPLTSVRETLPAGLTVVIDATHGCGGVRPIIDAIRSKSEGLPIKFIVFSHPEPHYDPAERLLVREVSEQPVTGGVEGELRTALKPFGLSETQLASFAQRAAALFTCAGATARCVNDDTA
ncbi:hypothetical protein RSOLAG22IIIB_04137 [Rhizoctonia solani]|uniref:Uncharacterized protein n=1 Tax=Rhizoctonia solani TaxID=456999 RepID=A0A0K6FUI6_9AGAM|nr:hypothetical protein RSOLAG22IIIB_04137 [Rhizoctonia solani]